MLSATAATAGLWLAACGGATASTSSVPAAAAHLMAMTELAAGQLASLPTGAQFPRIVVFHQAPGATTESKKHQPGIIYVQTGSQLLTYSATGQTTTISQGMGLFQESVTHTHTNAGTAMNTWYFMALWPSVQREAPLVAGAQDVYDGEDLPTSSLSTGPYTETLRHVTLQTGGRSPAHRFSGFEVVLVLDGTLSLHVAGHAATQLIGGQGSAVDPGTVTQELAASGSKVNYLAFFVTPQGQPFETDVTEAPR